MFSEKKDGSRAPLAEMDKDCMDPLHGAVGGVSMSFSPRKTSETDKEEGKLLNKFSPSGLFYPYILAESTFALKVGNRDF